MTLIARALQMGGKFPTDVLTQVCVEADKAVSRQSVGAKGIRKRSLLHNFVFGLKRKGYYIYAFAFFFTCSIVEMGLLLRWL